MWKWKDGKPYKYYLVSYTTTEELLVRFRTDPEQYAKVYKDGEWIRWYVTRGYLNKHGKQLKEEEVMVFIMLKELNR
jgi:hypothetical protein